MLTKTNQKDKGVLQDLKNQINVDISFQDWKIKKSKSENFLVLQQVGNCVWMSDNYEFIEKFYSKLYNRNFTSILCGGLGLGIIPFLVQNFCTKIDVVESDLSLINFIKNNTSHLGQSVNIIQGDFKTYQTSELYDVVLIDIYPNCEGSFMNERNVIMNKYSQNINSNGIVYIPIEEYHSITNFTNI